MWFQSEEVGDAYLKSTCTSIIPPISIRTLWAFRVSNESSLHGGNGAGNDPEPGG